MNEFLQQFLIESRELADAATAGLLDLERQPQDAAQLDAVFRALHTLKGGAGIVEFAAMERAVHAAENVLAAARAGQQLLTAAQVRDCLGCVDQVLQWLDTIERSGELPSGACDAEADRIIARFTGTVPAGAMHVPEPAPLPAAAGALPAPARELLAAQLALVREDTAAGSYGHLASAALTAAGVLRHGGREAEARQLAGLAAQGVEGLSAALLPALEHLLTGAAPATTVAGDSPLATPGNAAAAQTLRVDATRIDMLVRLTGELIVARNALTHLARQATTQASPLAAALKAQQATFEPLIDQLQRAVLGLRVLPLRVVFQRFPRLLREIADGRGKPVSLLFEGEDTEADKAIVEMLFEPLLHVVRNAVDHGVEPAALRQQRGKPPVATIRMRARRQGDQVLVEVSDDGGGMDVQRIRAVAAARGVATAEELAAMSDAEATGLVFMPGFSTAAAVTALSGRGVGMDAVRTAVERIGGRVSIQSQPQLGTTIGFLLPFSVMLTTVMSVEAGGQMFGVPLDTVVETIRVPRASIAAVGAARALVVRDQTIPVFDLAQMLGATGKPRHADEATIVIAACAGQHCGLDVDALGERLDIILKPLDGLLAGTPGITGTSVLGDGRVLLVLDIAGLLQ